MNNEDAKARRGPEFKGEDGGAELYAKPMIGSKREWGRWEG